ncbi:hypothetical protein BcDW1_9908 [Botrytis cinerea BcDW1]|uniref:RING zinc finger-like domain-containing protein n=1 Tax=Botryotinia fuckeliana (strain BcDW1) TaxID=1290391 RepID=M7U447_BOTF1|nr:hypothetical protein BcDW1_9908 [Botrytis cinerea BcDW1]
MPPRSSLTSSFSVSDANNEVVCPLRNQDGSSCRKRCLGEKRYRSMQEHIRRAHPEHYISKLPATEESFQLMINTPPSERPQPQPQPQPPTTTTTTTPANSAPTSNSFTHERQNYYGEHSNHSSTPNTPRILDDSSMLPAASAAATLAQLHNHKLDHEWESEVDWMSDNEAHKQAMRASIELPPIHSSKLEPTSDPFSHYNVHRRRDLLPSILSPPGRSSTLPPIQRNPSTGRPRKQSVSKRAREPQHRRQKSRGEHTHLRRLSHDRKAQSAEPSSAFYGKRWEDLIDAATSATEDVDDDRTPIPPSPVSVNRASMPPFSASQFHGYQASPLQQALTPPSYQAEAPEPFPSVESGGSGDHFNIGSQGLSDSSPSFSAINIQIYCAACQNVSFLKESYACTECICGICQPCVEVLMAEQGARRKCPRCATIGGRFKPFQLDIR